MVWAALWLAAPAAADLGLVLRAEPRALWRRDGDRVPRVHPRQAAGRLAGGRAHGRPDVAWRWSASSCCGGATPPCGSSPSGGSPCSVSCWPSGWWAPCCSSALGIRRGPDGPRTDPPHHVVGSGAAVRPGVGGHGRVRPRQRRAGGRARVERRIARDPLPHAVAPRSWWSWSARSRCGRRARLGIALIVAVARSRRCSSQPLEDSFVHSRLPARAWTGADRTGVGERRRPRARLVAGLALVAVLATGRADGAAR